MPSKTYTLSDTHFAYAYRVYLRCHTHRRASLSALAALDTHQFSSMAGKYNIKILESATDETDLVLQLSLRPEETVSACASKLKGQVSKHLRALSGNDCRQHLLGRGYFACTSGNSTGDAIAVYLGKQGAHHGYAQRVIPPVHVEIFPLTAEDEVRLNPTHASTCLQFHVVLATWQRHGVFGAESGPVVARCWQELGKEERFALLKVSFVPDHVHIALRVHPGVAPGELAVKLMTAAEGVMRAQFREHMIHAGMAQLWQPSAYLGSYGDTTSKTVTGYMKKWEASL